MRTVALIPAHNEAQRIAATLEALATVRGIDDVIVVDDASTDGTETIARRSGATVLRLERNLGKGGALEAGAEHAGDPDVLLLLDGDLGTTAAQAGALLAPVLEQVADMTIACFPRPAGKAGFGLVMGLARWGIRRLGGPFDAQAPLSGQRALNRAAMSACRPFESGYGVEVALTVRALKAGLRLVEVETTMAHAATGRNLAGFLHRGRQFSHIAGALMRLARERTR